MKKHVIQHKKTYIIGAIAVILLYASIFVFDYYIIDIIIPDQD